LNAAQNSGAGGGGQYGGAGSGQPMSNYTGGRGGDGCILITYY